ncbi:MAG: PCRF domain-containing protein, partial [bacterium]|nr:PCRF domain-containing protein [bacterium]
MDQSRHYLEQELAQLQNKIAQTQELLTDSTMVEEARKELVELESQKVQLEKALTEPAEIISLDQAEDFNSVILEARPGVGGDEA